MFVSSFGEGEHTLCKRKYKNYYILKCDINKFFHSINKEKLKIKYYVRYQDDFLLFHESKDYLKECLIKIRDFLNNEDLTLNKKTRIYKNTDNFVFLGRNKEGEYGKYRSIKRKIKKSYYLYNRGKLNLNEMLSVLRSFKKLNQRYF